MTALWKFILFIYNLLLMAAGAALIVAGVDHTRLDRLVSFITKGSGWNRVALCVTGVLIVFIALAMILISLISSSSSRVSSINLATGQGGQVSISTEAVRSMVGKAISRVYGVREVKTTISGGDSGVRVVINLAVVGDDTFVNLSAQVQSKVKEYLVQTGGLKVEEVAVFISETSAPLKNAPEAAEPEAAIEQEA
jgi:uncharacterized alkaline shock family protein YloU